MDSKQQELPLPSSEFNMTLVAGSVKGAMRAADAKSRDLWQVPVDKIKTMPEFNVRVRDAKYLAHLRTIANSILAEGFYQHEPLVGFVANEAGENVIYITGGHTRLESTGIANSEGAEIQVLPVVINPPGTSREDLVVALIKGNDKGKPLTPYESGVVCKRLVNYGWTVEKIAKRLDYSEVYVDGLLLLVGAPQEIREMVQSGEVSATTAIQTLRAMGSTAVDHLQSGLTRAKATGAKRVTSKHLPGFTFKKEVKKAAPKLYDALKGVKGDPGYQHISEELRSTLEDLLAMLEASEQEKAAETTEAEGNTDSKAVEATK